MKAKVVLIASLLLISFAFTFCTKKDQPPVASFTCDLNSGVEPLTVHFFSTSKGVINTLAWSFGDGGTASTPNTFHTYNSAGTYSASLTATGPGGPSSSTKTITVTPAAPVAGFTCDYTSGTVPLTVNFTSTSTGTITSYSWDFGDGGTSTSQNPSHIYNSNGSFNVALTVTGPGGSKSSNQTISVAPKAGFTYSPANPGNAPVSITFTSTSTGTISSYSWDFGDGGSSTSQNPSHTFSNGGTYSVTLTVTGSGGSNSSSLSVTVGNNPGTDVTFYNKSFTTITITLNSVTKTILSGSSVTYTGVQGSSVTYSAYTYGKTSTGTQIGLEMDWNGTLTLSGGTKTCDLNVSSTYFFLYVTNSSSYNLYNLYVNKGTVAQTHDNIVISNNGVKTALGYFAAYTNTNVYLYNSTGSLYWYWVYSTNFTFPWTVNQYISLTATKSGKSGDLENSNLPTSSVYKKDPNVIDLNSK